MRMVGYAACITIVLGCAAGCGVADQSASESASESSPADPRYAASDGYQACLDDRGIAYRLDSTTLGTPDTPAVVLVDPDDPDVASANTDCQAAVLAAQVAAAGPDASAVNNQHAQQIVDCLLDRGFHVTTDDGDGMTYGDGTPMIVWHVPDAEMESAQYMTAQQECSAEVYGN